MGTAEWLSISMEVTCKSCFLVQTVSAMLAETLPANF